MFKNIKTPEDLQAEKDEIKANEVRAERDKLLNEADVAVFKAEDMGASNVQDFRTYRQDLRDVPEQTGFPDNVIWPVKPSIIV